MARRNHTFLRLIAEIQAAPGARQADYAKRLGISPSAISYNVRRHKLGNLFLPQPRICLQCSQLLKTYPKDKLCPQCRRLKSLVSFTCALCGQTQRITRSKIKQRLKVSRSGNLFCSHFCQGLFLRTHSLSRFKLVRLLEAKPLTEAEAGRRLNLTRERIRQLKNRYNLHALFLSRNSKQKVVINEAKG